jgi:tetratricopeptide (TPR) repeat protein
MHMKKIYIIIGIITWITLVAGCTKKSAPATSLPKSIKSTDTVAYDYVYIEAIKQKLLGNIGDALTYLEQCIEMDPQNDAAYYQMAQISMQRGDLENGKQYGLKAVKLDDKNFWYLTMMANIYYQEKTYDSSIYYYEEAIRDFPEKESVKLALADVFSQKGDFRKADDIYKSLEIKYGLNENISLLYIKNLINAKNYKRAEEKVLQLLKTSPDEIVYNGLLAEIYHNMGENNKAFDIYKKLMGKDPSNPQTLLSLTGFLVTEKNYDDLLTILNNVVRSDEIRKENKIALLANLMDNQDLLNAKASEFELILKIFEDLNKEDPVIVLLRPDLYEKTGQNDKAIERLEEIIKENSNNYYAWEKLLLLYSDMQDYDKLLIRGEECATKFNMSFLAKVLYASAAIEKGKYDIAGEELAKAKILAGDQKQMQIQVMSMEADLYYREKEYDKCYEKFREALKIDPQDIIVLNNYAYYLAEQDRDLKNAEKMAAYVIEKEKDNSIYLDTYAWVLYKRGKVKEAVRIMEDIISKGEKDDAEWYEHLGYMMKALRKCEQAIEYWKRAMELDSTKSGLEEEIKNCKK